MTTNSTPPADTWNTALSTAFEVLLGRKLSSFDTTAIYGVYCGGNYVDEVAPPAPWLTPKALASREPVKLDGGPYLYDDDHCDLAWQWDLSESLFS